MRVNRHSLIPCRKTSFLIKRRSPRSDWTARRLFGALATNSPVTPKVANAVGCSVLPRAAGSSRVQPRPAAHGRDRHDPTAGQEKEHNKDTISIPELPG